MEIGAVTLFQDQKSGSKFCRFYKTPNTNKPNEYT
jgi:hypothetical protein